MLRLSKKVDYAIILLSHLCTRDQPISAQEVAQSHHLPQPMVANILKQLAHGGLLDSKRGQHGGYSLARPAVQISLADIIRAIEGPVNFVECADGQGQCKVSPYCSARQPLLALHWRIERFMESLTLDQVVNHPQFNSHLHRSVHEVAHLS